MNVSPANRYFSHFNVRYHISNVQLRCKLGTNFCNLLHFVHGEKLCSFLGKQLIFDFLKHNWPHTWKKMNTNLCSALCTNVYLWLNATYARRSLTKNTYWIIIILISLSFKNVVRRKVIKKLTPKELFGSNDVRYIKLCHISSLASLFKQTIH